jgi:hypothetical protein
MAAVDHPRRPGDPARGVEPAQQLLVHARKHPVGLPFREAPMRGRR